MATLEFKHPTLVDVARRQDPDGGIATVVEILEQQNIVMEAIPWMEANDQTGHRTTVRTGLPNPTWRRAYGGVQPTKSTTAQVTDTIGTLEAYAEVDMYLADLGGNAPMFRMTESMAHMQGMNNEFMQTLIYGNEGTANSEFTGLAPRYNDMSAENASNILNGGGTGTDNTSIWLITWGMNSCHGIYPKGLTAGLKVEDMGQVTIEDIDGNGGRMEAYRSHFVWHCGISVRDWRYIVRICNIDSSELTRNASSGADLIDLMTEALGEIPYEYGKMTFLVNRDTMSILRRQVVNKVTQSTLTMDDVAGHKPLMFGGIPVYRTDAILNTEATVN